MKTKLWEPSKAAIESSSIYSFIKQINQKYKKEITTFKELQLWSVKDKEDFWGSAADFLNIKFITKPDRVLTHSSDMISTKWFEGSTLNYAENCLLNPSNDLAVYEVDEDGLKNTITRDDLYQLVSKWAQFFDKNGIRKGDRVAGILPNNLTALVAMLGATSLGAVWSSCSPDFGEQGICDRLEQIQPKCIISLPSYQYKGKFINIVGRLNQIKEKLNLTTLWINASDEDIKDWISVSSIYNLDSCKIKFVACQFQDPLFILFSSGTTGKPKCIVHSVGGTLLQHKKEHQLHCNLQPSDTLFYYTTCGWMMWNWMVSALACNASIVLFDGAAITPNGSIWDLVNQFSINIFGCSASFIGASEKRKINLATKLSCQSTHLILTTGSPLLSSHYDYLYSQFNYPIQVGSISGGTDIISCFALCNPMTPVYRGFLQGKGLGMDIVAYDETGNEVIEKKGDLVCQSPAPCMPIHFLNDSDNEKYKAAYFKNGEVKEWYHGDYIFINDDGSLEILGRSDSTLNPGGIRIGTAEFYQVLENVSGVIDSLASSIISDNDEKIVLFVKLDKDVSLTHELKKSIKLLLKEKASPRHMPHMIIQVNEIPYTMNGKKCEVNVKKILRGEDLILQKSSLLNENSFNEYIEFATQNSLS